MPALGFPVSSRLPYSCGPHMCGPYRASFDEVCYEKMCCNSCISYFSYCLRLRPGRQRVGNPRADRNARAHGRVDFGADGHPVPDARADDGGV